MDIHVKFPDDKVAILDFIGLVFDTSIILEDKLEVGLRPSLHKIDRYFYENIVSIEYVMNGLYTFQVDITVRER